VLDRFRHGGSGCARAQIKAAYKEQAGTIIANHGTMLFYSGIRYADTYDLATRIVGDEEIVNRQAVAESTTTSTLVPSYVLRQQSTGSAPCISRQPRTNPNSERCSYWQRPLGR
jgi:hypothetical protein